jgi:hypothetical protein
MGDDVNQLRDIITRRWVDVVDRYWNWRERRADRMRLERIYRTAMARGLDSFDVLPPVGIPQPPPDPDGTMRLALPEDFDG